MKASVKGILGLSENLGILAVPMFSSKKKERKKSSDFCFSLDFYFAFESEKNWIFLKHKNIIIICIKVQFLQSNFKI